MEHQHGAADHVHDASDPACRMAHGELPAPVGDRRLVIVFASPVARELAHFAHHLAYDVTVLDPAPGSGLAGLPWVCAAGEAGLDAITDVVVTDHDRPELGEVLAEVLAHPTRWVGVMGSLRHTAPHVAALRERGLDDATIGRVHRPIGLDIGSRSPAEIAVATLAGLLADRNGRPGGAFGTA